MLSLSLSFLLWVCAPSCRFHAATSPSHTDLAFATFASQPRSSGEEYGTESDWWSFGCTLFALFAGRSPFHKSVTGMTDADQATLEWKIKLPSSLEGVKAEKLLPGGSKATIKALLDRDTEKRLTPSRGLREHSFFKKVNFAEVASCKSNGVWVPKMGGLYVPEQDLVAKSNKDAEHASVVLDGSEAMPDFDYVNIEDHERDIVNIIKLGDAGGLKHLPGSVPGSKAGGCALQ